MRSRLIARALADVSPYDQWRAAFRYLRAGLMMDGWALHEARRNIHDHPANFLPTDAPAWDGAAGLKGKRILLWHEQGLGDSILLFRFVPHLIRLGARVILAVQPPLARLAAQIPGIAGTVTDGETFEDPDFHAPLFSLPYLLGVRLGNLPSTVPYLSLPPGVVATWHDRLGPRIRPRIGLIVSGNPAYRTDAARRVPLDATAPLLAMPGYEFHLLQNHLRPDDADALVRYPVLHTHFPDLTDVAEVGGLATQMDLILSSCTMGAHLAGALALPVWLMLGSASFHIWLQDRTDSPWYPTARLFRQDATGTWPPVIDRIRAALPLFPVCPTD